ncbi:unnamed protein product [Linum trigynum]|uniref:Uncharacterized protein n=1 Tax=Linum trigynum TaxID=586398 RepID=A0AAV2CX65_9ROSI
MSIRQNNTLFLEQWLSSISGNVSTSQSSSSLSSRAIVQTWAEIRDCLQSQALQPRHLQSMNLLLDYQVSLYVADTQAKLLLSILSSEKIALPNEAYTPLLRLLYVWVRKSSRPSPSLMDSAADVLLKFLDTEYGQIKNPILFANTVLLLAAISYVPSASERSKTVCLDLVCRLLEQDYMLISSFGALLLSHVLAGIGYALRSSGNAHFVRILDSLLGIWGKEDGPPCSLPNGLMILHLVEWVIPGMMKLNSQDKLLTFTIQALEIPKLDYPPFGLVMAAGGVLRALNRSITSVERLDLVSRLRVSSENLLRSTAQNLIKKMGGFISVVNDGSTGLLLQCISLAVARAGPISSHASLLISMAAALLTEIVPLRRLYTRILGSSVSSQGPEFDEAKEHLNSVPFKEAGSITACFCNQYVSADEESRNVVENAFWRFCQEIYSGHRLLALLLHDREDQLLSNIEKMAESAFLMVVVFASTVSKHKLSSGLAPEIRMQTSVSILVSFSCMEYFRRIRLPEYMDTIRGVVVSVQENETACTTFVESLPPYADLTNAKEFPHLVKYTWLNDEVQTSRILFYLRVIPTCIERLSAPLFSEVVTPTMFLYMEHPNEKVSRASHSMFVAFISLGKEADVDETAPLKEQLAFYYILKSLSGYPEFTPFDGMASGFAHLIQHLPAGSPATFYCIHNLVEKAQNLCSKVSVQNADLWKNWQGELEPCKKLLDLLLRFISLVDIQVLPDLMKLLAQLIIQLPKDGQNVVLNELYEHVAESDDVIRKPSLVSWLQSLSYLCSKDFDNTSRSAASENKIVYREGSAAPLTNPSQGAEGLSSRL